SRQDGDLLRACYEAVLFEHDARQPVRDEWYEHGLTAFDKAVGQERARQGPLALRNHLHVYNGPVALARSAEASVNRIGAAGFVVDARDGLAEALSAFVNGVEPPHLRFIWEKLSPAAREAVLAVARDLPQQAAAPSDDASTYLTENGLSEVAGLLLSESSV